MGLLKLLRRIFRRRLLEVGQNLTLKYPGGALLFVMRTGRDRHLQLVMQRSDCRLCRMRAWSLN